MMVVGPSRQSASSKFELTYTNAELACHAIEMYTDRLRAGEQDKLKVRIRKK